MGWRAIRLRKFLFLKVRLGRHGFEYSYDPLNRTSKILNIGTLIAMLVSLFTIYALPLAIGFFALALVYKEPERGQTR